MALKKKKNNNNNKNKKKKRGKKAEDERREKRKKERNVFVNEALSTRYGNIAPGQRRQLGIQLVPRVRLCIHQPKDHSLSPIS